MRTDWIHYFSLLNKRICYGMYDKTYSLETNRLTSVIIMNANYKNK